MERKIVLTESQSLLVSMARKAYDAAIRTAERGWVDVASVVFREHGVKDLPEGTFAFGKDGRPESFVWDDGVEEPENPPAKTPEFTPPDPGAEGAALPADETPAVPVGGGFLSVPADPPRKPHRHK